jgi:MFS family permease
MLAIERRAALSLATLFALRMLGLFMVLLVFALYALHLQYATPTLIGLALGIYGLTQALLQIPFGSWSDRIGRKPIIFIGFIIFIVGSVIAALSTSIYLVIIGRALQGAGAVGSTMTAMLADLTSEQNRTKAMAILGMTVGLAFSLAMVLGPLVNTLLSAPAIFWFSALFGFIALILLFTWVPSPTHTSFHRDVEPLPALVKSVMKHPELLRLNLGIFVAHALLIASFVVLPIALHNYAKIAQNHQWWIYLLALLIALAIVVPMIIIGEKKQLLKQLFISSIILLIISEIVFTLGFHNVISIVLGLVIFFTAFSFLEAALPSLVSKIAPVAAKGTALGVYSSAQFLGIFIGGYLGGWFYQHYGIRSVFLISTLLALLWLLVAITMKNPRYLATYMINIGALQKDRIDSLMQKLSAIPGVAEVVIIAQEGIAYLKVDSRITTFEELQQCALTHINLNSGEING